MWSELSALAEVCAMMLLPSGRLMRLEQWFSNRILKALLLNLFFYIYITVNTCTWVSHSFRTFGRHPYPDIIIIHIHLMCTFEQ